MRRVWPEVFCWFFLQPVNPNTNARNPPAANTFNQGRAF